MFSRHYSLLTEIVRPTHSMYQPAQIMEASVSFHSNVASVQKVSVADIFA
jgi:hypothetical protein